MSAAPGALAPWWSLPQAAERWVRDVVCAEMAALRPQGWRWPAVAPGADLHWQRDAGLDSLERVAIATAVADAADLHDAPQLQALEDSDTWRGWASVVAGAFAHRPPAHRFRSSGSTGHGSRHLHALADLVEELEAALLDFAPGAPVLRLVSTVRSHHIYGFLFTQLLPWVLQHRGLAVPEVVDLVGKSPALVKATARAGDWIIGFPEFWAMANRSATPWPAGVVGLSSTAPCPLSVAQAAQAQGLSHWIEIYGSTETAGLAWRSDPQAPFRLHRHWQRDPQDGLAVLRHGVPHRRVALPDRVEWVDERHVRPTARQDGQVQVGGINVNPDQVVECLCRHPSVREAAVRTHATPHGDRLKAFVVVDLPSSAVSAALAELQAWCRERLPAAACPVSIAAGPALPRTEMGKLRDWDPGQYLQAT